MKHPQCAILILCLLFMLSSQASGQIGFNLLNQRNHPELHWQTLESPHFKIIFHQRLDALAIRTANIAEDYFDTLTANLRHAPHEKIPVFLSDQDEIANGFDVSNRYIVIWVNANRYIEHTTGTDKWLRKVLAHELVHYLHFSKISTWSGFLGHGFTQTPRWFIEGIAQYYSETWNVHRGDLVLRTRVLENEMEYAGFQTPTDGQMLYATGNSAVRYLAQCYGDSAIDRLLDHRCRFILPYYNFNKAFLSATGRSPKTFLNEWRKQISIYYNSAYAQKEEIANFAQRLQLPFQFISDFQISPDSSRLAVVGIVSMIEPVSKLYLLDAVQRRIIKILDHNNVLPGIGFSPNSQQLVYAKYHRGENGSLIPDILVTDLFGHKRWITRNKRARMPIWAPNGHEIICVVNSNGTDNLWAFAPDSPDGRMLTHFTGDTQLNSPRPSPDGRWLAFLLADSVGNRNLVALASDGLQMWEITRDSIDQRNPAWSPDSKQLAFTSYRTGVPNIFLKNLAADAPQNWWRLPTHQVTDAALGIYLLDWQQDSLVTHILESKQSQQIYRISADRRVTAHEIEIDSRYDAWQHHRPPFGIPQYRTTQTVQIQKKYKYQSLKEIQHYFTIPLPLVDATRTGFSFLSYWAEPLGKHQLLGFGDVTINAPSRSRYLFSYLNNQWHPTLVLSAVYYPLEAQFFADKLLIIEKKGVNVTSWVPFNLGNDLHSNHAITAGFSFFNNQPLNLNDFINESLQPDAYQTSEFSIGYRWKKIAPHHWNMIHPLSARGIKLQANLADKRWGSQLTYRIFEFDTYRNNRLPWQSHVIYTRLLIQAAQGDLPQQQQLGFDKYDQLDFGLGLPLGERPRLRGESEYHFGNRIVFGNIEYRFPLVHHLRWFLAGISFGQLAGCGFLDFGAVWNSRETPMQKVSFLKTAGFELKNTISLGIFSFVHEIGWAKKLNAGNPDSEFYYRIRSVVPF